MLRNNNRILEKLDRIVKKLKFFFMSLYAVMGLDTYPFVNMFVESSMVFQDSMLWKTHLLLCCYSAVRYIHHLESEGNLSVNASYWCSIILKISLCLMAFFIILMIEDVYIFLEALAKFLVNFEDPDD